MFAPQKLRVHPGTLICKSKSRVADETFPQYLFSAMKLPLLPLLFIILALGARAETSKSYQVTGPIIALTDNVITVQKDDEKWEIARSAATKTDGKLAVGSRVTVHYKMTADSIEVKDTGKGADKSAEKKKKTK